MKSDKFIDRQIRKIEKLADLKQQEIDREQYRKYSPIFHVAYKILKRQKILLYGGMAINELLPKKLKIYDKDSKLPDIDVFSTNAEKVATKIVAAFKKHDFPVSSYGDAIHEGTYKIYVQGLQIVDITNVSRKAFRRLSHNSVTGDLGIRIVNLQFIRMSLHTMLSQPNDAHRWSKVFGRLVAFYNIFPPSAKCLVESSYKENETAGASAKTAAVAVAEIKDRIYSHLKDTEFILFGNREIERFFAGAPPVAPHGGGDIQILVKEDVKEVATHIIEQLGGGPHAARLSLSTVYEGDDFIPRHIYIKYGATKVMGIYLASACVSYVEIGGYRIASIHTIIRMYMLMLFSSYSHFEKYYDNLECLVNGLAILQYKNIASKKKLFKDFVTQCYGIHKGLVTLKRERLLRYLK